MKNFKFLLVFLWLAVNSYADESRILVKAYTPNTIKFKLPNEYWDTEVKGKCNITVYTLKNTKMQFTLEPPNYETSFEYTPSDLGKTYLIWKGEEKDSGWFSTMKACPSSGYINLFVVGSREQIQQRWIKYFESVSSDKKSCIINALNLKNINIYSTNTNDRLVDPDDSFVTESLENVCSKFVQLPKPSINVSCNVGPTPTTCNRIYVTKNESNNMTLVKDDLSAIDLIMNGKVVESFLRENEDAREKRIQVENEIKREKEIQLIKKREEEAELQAKLEIQRREEEKLINRYECTGVTNMVQGYGTRNEFRYPPSNARIRIDINKTRNSIAFTSWSSFSSAMTIRDGNDVFGSRFVNISKTLAEASCSNCNGLGMYRIGINFDTMKFVAFNTGNGVSANISGVCSLISKNYNY